MEALLYFVAIASIISVGLGGLVLFKLMRGIGIPIEQSNHMSLVERSLEALPGIIRDEARLSREELQRTLTSFSQLQEARLTAVETTITARLTEFAKAQSEQLGLMRSEASDGRNKLENAIQRHSEAFAQTQTTRLHETNEAVKQLSDKLVAAQKDARETQQGSLEKVTNQVAALIESNASKHDALRDAISQSLDKLRTENLEKLEQMRATVDEKLQGTLEKRLGESFKLVSDRLEQVHRGLGEMQNLATGVGDLKRVLTNVKSRGGWGEVQLGMLLDDMLTPEQFAKNVRIRPDSGEVVEYGVRLPGRGDDQAILLPIDCKFPHEDYDRLLAAQDVGLADDVERAAMALERGIRTQAKAICEKYVHPPYSTDFAIMYLPTEGLFAEVVRRPGLAGELQSKHRVMVTGPTTLAAVLSSLQMGFRTLAIEKRSSEVWQVLAAAKAEFSKYGQVWEKVGKQLDTAKKTVEEAGRRTRAVNRQLRDVETLELPNTNPILGLIEQEMDSDVPDTESRESDAEE